MKRSLLSLLALVVAGSVAAYGGFWDNAYQTLDFLATPTGSPLSLTADGTRVNGNRSGRLRIVPNDLLGHGYRLEYDRSFGSDSRGRPETIRLGGLASLTLDGGTQFTAGYNRLGKLWTAQANVVANSLNYTLQSRNTGQDVELKGTLNVTGDVTINTLGFYTVNLNASNTNSQLKIDGVVVRERGTTNFDVGPIAISGNIFADGAIALLGALGVDTSGLEYAFHNSPIDQINNAITSGLQQTQALLSGAATAATAKDKLSPLLLQSVLGGDPQAATRLLAGLADGSLATGADNDAAPVLHTPEPGTLLLVGLGMALWSRRRRS